MKKNKRPFKVNYYVLSTLLLIHVGAFAAPFFFSWSAFLCGVILWQVTGTLGITVGYHRLLAHQSFKTYPWVTRIHALLGALTFQQGPLSWVRLHRAHHKYADGISDPHPQQFGFLFGHIGWPFISITGVGESGLRMISPSHLKRDRFLVFVEKNFLAIGLISLVMIYLLGGLSYLLWAGFVRIVWTLHVTLMVNSICHRFGYRSFDTPDNSRNNILVALITAGEGWHNNHHKFPFSPKVGLKVWELDTSWLWIKFLHSAGLAWDLKMPRDDKDDNFVLRKVN